MTSDFTPHNPEIVGTRVSPDLARQANQAKQDSGALRHLWMSPWVSWVGMRYLKSKKNSRFLSFITFISIFGVALGVMAMIVVLSVMDGFEAELKKRLMSSDLHVLITPTADVTGFSEGYVPKTAIDSQELIHSMAHGGQIESFWPIVSTEAILKTTRKVSGVILKGISQERLARLKTQITETAETQMLYDHDGPEATRLPGLFVGQELAYEMGIIPGDRVTLISPTETEGPLDSVPRMKRFVVEGIYHSGLPDQELHTAFALTGAVRSYIRKADVVSQWEVTVKNFDKAPVVANEIQRLMPKFKAQDWIQLNAHLFASLRLERIAMFVVLSFIIIVASFNIVTTLTLMVLEKRREIAILKAMGARHGQVAAIFLAEGILIGGLGVGGGTIIGSIICSILRRYEFIQLPDIYYDRTLPVTFDLRYYAGVAICAIAIVLGACLYPSKRAAKMNPLDGIRFG